MILDSLQERRKEVTVALLECPYNAKLYLARSQLHEELGFPDLAAGDAYKALLLSDELQDISGDYHDQAADALNEESSERLAEIGRDLALSSCKILIRSLIACGCLRSAHEQCTLALLTHPNSEALKELQQQVIREGTTKEPNTAFDPSDLPDSGLVRREIYPWNDHEPDRYSAANLASLNLSLSKIAPKLTAKATSLPILSPSSTPHPKTSKQLGLFAIAPISPGETILRETTLLTASNRLHDPLCDACSGPLPPISSRTQTYSCPSCDDTVFCSAPCLSAAQTLYHPAICNTDIDAIAKDVPPAETPDALYFLLLARTIALAETQALHPLDLPQTRFLWGEFVPAGAQPSLPWSFKYHVLYPTHVLERMGLDVFAGLERWDTWVVNTLYAKFRGVASGRVNEVSGRPEVCAVHPLWCLANHSCAPNVRWEWGGEIRFWAREGKEVVRWGEGKGEGRGGIAVGEEVLNHYCDVELSVGERREWARGALGGACRCGRCVWEAGEEGERA